jgi:E3 ubiquitin-protein ligase FANCL
MELPATLSSAPARSQAPADEEAYTDARQDGQAARRPAAFYSSVFAQVRQPLDEMPAPTEAAGVVFCVSLFTCADLVTSRSFHLFIYFLWAFRLQIEEIGWERVVSAAGDDGVSCLTFRVV